MSAQKTQKAQKQKCYNSFSCILSVLIIVFVLTSIVWDMLVTKPAIRDSIEQIKTEVQVIHSKIDKSYNTNTLDSDSIVNTIYELAEETGKK
jgi:hypothetical protein